MFVKYQSVKRIGTTEVDGILVGEVYVFPKIDGTNASVWMEDGEVKAGSRRRQLSLEDDNAGFYTWVLTQENIKQYLEAYPSHRLFGEWLVPHSLKTYRDDAWRKFYIFDVCVDKSPDKMLHDGDDSLTYIPYSDYVWGMMEFDLEFIRPSAILKNPSEDDIAKELGLNSYLIQNGKGVGEGVVLKNYSFKNRFNRMAWAKVVTSEFKEKHNKENGPVVRDCKSAIEQAIAEEFVTAALCEKTLAKIKNDVGHWDSSMIPRLLNTVYYDVVNEEMWNVIKKHKNPTIDFRSLQQHVYAKVKKSLPNTF